MSEPLESEVAERVQALLPEDLRPLGVALAATVARRHPYGLPADPQTRAAVIAEGVRLIVERPPGTLALRMSTPERRGGSMISLVVEDAPFLLSTIAGELERMQLAIANQAYPEFGVVRDETGAIRELRPARGADERQTWIHVELTRRLDEDRLQEVATALRAVLGDAQRATGDFDAMRERAAQIADQLQQRAGADEATALVRWLIDGHLVFLGAVDYDVDGTQTRHDPDSGLGVLRPDGDRSRDVERWLPLRTSLEPDGPPLTVSLTHRRSTVHRHERMMDVVVLTRAADGHRLRRLIGLFATKATSEPVTTIPVLRQWVEQVIAAEDVVTNSHDERMLRSVLEALPKDALFTAGAPRLAAIFDTLVRHERGVVRVVAWAHAPSAAVMVVVALPRERFDVRLRERIDDLVARRLETEPAPPFVAFHEDEALLTYVLELETHRHELDLTAVAAQLRGEIRALSQTW
ncbi:MAG TPA: hypothetical protein VK891_09390, partial [Euzebyales bacterium]|nr:hypothetical protein [Euzebyales bacterium]